MSDTIPCPLCGEDDGYTTEYLSREECLLVLCRSCLGPVAKAEDKRFVDDAWNYACAHAQALRERVEVLHDLSTRHKRTIRAMVGWLEENQSDVFRNGLWDAISAERSGSTSRTCLDD